MNVVLTSIIASSATEAVATDADKFISKKEPPEQMLSVLRSLDFEDSKTLSQ